LPVQAWTVELPRTWPEKESESLRNTFAEYALPRPGIRIEPNLPPGLRIRCGDACLDATVDSLIDRRSEIEARLLASWERRLANAEEAT
jgi:hypothetical protein